MSPESISVFHPYNMAMEIRSHQQATALSKGQGLLIVQLYLTLDIMQGRIWNLDQLLPGFLGDFLAYCRRITDALFQDTALPPLVRSFEYKAIAW